MGERRIAQGGETGAWIVGVVGAARNEWGSIRKMVDEGWVQTFFMRLGSNTPTPAHMHGQAQTQTPGRQSLNHSNRRRVNQSMQGSHSLSAVQTLTSKCCPTSFHRTTFSLFISPVVKTTAFTVLRKSIITVTKPKSGVEAPDGEGVFVVSPLWSDNHHFCLYTGNPSYCTCCFFSLSPLDDGAKSLPSATLNPMFTEKSL